MPCFSLSVRWLKGLQHRLDQLSFCADADCTTRSSTQLIAQNQFLQQIINNAPGSIYVKDLEGRFLIANQAAAEIHGTTVEAMLGKKDPEFNPNLSQKQFEQFLAVNRQVMETRRSIQTEPQAIETASGELRWYQTKISPLLNEAGQVFGIIGNSVDITALKEM